MTPAELRARPERRPLLGKWLDRHDVFDASVEAELVPIDDGDQAAQPLMVRRVAERIPQPGVGVEQVDREEIKVSEDGA